MEPSMEWYEIIKWFFIFLAFSLASMGAATGVALVQESWQHRKTKVIKKSRRVREYTKKW